MKGNCTIRKEQINLRFLVETQYRRGTRYRQMWNFAKDPTDITLFGNLIHAPQ